MKKIVIFTALLLCTLMGYSQLPSVKVYKLDGKAVNTSSFDNNGHPYVVCVFFADNKDLQEKHHVNPSYTGLDRLYEKLYAERNDTNVKIIAIHSGKHLSAKDLSVLSQEKGWPFELYSDPQSLFIKECNVHSMPAIYVIDKNGKVAFEQHWYNDGTEDVIAEKVRALAKE